ncbi:hypothetical protein O6H91_19G005400 [Diphasiastrum complanatum]|uniref:Uncharacterized protein n=1 Tax=Diphasiastrum complanatum TaxID=34168 RepID=A0ACC2ATP8_DIPCM|nr:hypothetical protein O6H91_19G005400 [Diphasiastrum complanatum]
MEMFVKKCSCLSIISLITTLPALSCICIWALIVILAGYTETGYSIQPDSNGRCFGFLVAFGDSLTDTGNAQRIFPLQQRRAGMHPYGQTFFRRPCDRFSDGRLLIDFIAQALQLPFLDPYVKGAGSSFLHGVNLATSGATVTNVTFLVPYTLKVQLYWLKKVKANIVQSLQSPVVLQSLPTLDSFNKALYVVWIGGNDYNAQFFIHGMKIDELMKSVRRVINTMSSDLEVLYQEGARAILVVNLPPVGCTPQLLTFVRGHSDEYDSVGCYKPFNKVLQAHNALLRELLRNLTQLHPDAAFIYADYYSIAYHILQHPSNYGMFDVLNSCCGAGGSYNFNITTQCGMSIELNASLPIPVACLNPAIFSNWDGIHPTEALTQIVAAAFLAGQYLEPANAFSNCTFDMTGFL